MREKRTAIIGLETVKSVIDQGLQSAFSNFLLM